MKELNEEVRPILKFESGKYTVFSRFRFLGIEMLGYIVEKEENLIIEESDMSIEEMKKEDFAPLEISATNRTNTVTATDKHGSVYTIGEFLLADKELSQFMAGVLAGSRQNKIPLKYTFYTEQLAIKIIERKPTKFSPELRNNVMWNMRPWKVQLRALGLEAERAEQYVKEYMEEFVTILNSRIKQCKKEKDTAAN